MTFILGWGWGWGVEGVVDLDARIVATWYTFWFECETTLSYVELCNYYWEIEDMKMSIMILDYVK